MGLFFSKHFTIQEADGWIPQLRNLFRQIHEALQDVEPEVRLIYTTLQHRGNGGGIDSQHYFSHDQEIEHALSEIQGAGIVIQDIGRGLIDFPAMLDGREVFLCWQLDDGERIDWYHELDAGFAGRRRLSR